jgi:hypothetical protein
MSDQQQFPDAFGVLRTYRPGLRQWWDTLLVTHQDCRDGDECFRLIPEPEVDRLVREAEQRGYLKALQDDDRMNGLPPQELGIGMPSDHWHPEDHVLFESGEQIQQARAAGKVK